MAGNIANDDTYQNDELDMMTRRVLAKKEIKDFTNSPGSTPIYNWLRQSSAKIMDTDGSGTKLEFYTDFGEADGGFYEGHEAINVGGISGLNRGEVGWRRAYGGATLYEVDILSNSGEAQVMDAVKRSVEKSKQKIVSTIANSVMVAQSGNSLDSIYDALYTENYAGIAREALSTTKNRYDITAITASENYFWHPIYEEYDISDTEDLTTAGKGLWTLIKSMSRVLRHLGECNNNDTAQIILCNEATYEWLGDQAQNKIQYFWPVADPQYINMGFKGLSFQGMPITIAPEMSASTFNKQFIFLNNKYIGLQDNPKDNFKFDGWKDATDNTRSRQCKFWWAGNIFCTNPGGLAVLKGVA